MDISQHSEEIIVTVHRLALEAVLKQVADSPVFDIIPIYEPSAQALEDLFQALCAFLDQQVDMVSHEAICEQLEFAYCLTVFQDFEELFIIFPVLKNLLLVDTPEHDMVNSAFAFLSRLSWHISSPQNSIPSCSAAVNTQNRPLCYEVRAWLDANKSRITQDSYQLYIAQGTVLCVDITRA